MVRSQQTQPDGTLHVYFGFSDDDMHALEDNAE